MAADDRILSNILQKLESIERAMRNGTDVRSAKILDIVAIELKLRRVRDQHFDGRYFTDWAWEILLDLKQSARLNRILATGDLGLGAGIPHTTLLRYIDVLVKDGYVLRYPDPNDGRRVLVELSELGSETMNAIFDKVSQSLEQYYDYVETEGNLSSVAAATR